jgi:uncharacterized membrane protein YqhA
MLGRVLVGSRFFLLIGVASSFIAFLVLLVYAAAYGATAILHVAVNLETSEKELKALALALIESVDASLLATVFYIVSLGLYSLFIDDTLALPPWLSIHNIDDLKGKLASVVIVVLGVLFLGYAIAWDGQLSLLPLGGAIASVMAALTYFLSQKPGKEKN